MGVFTKRLYKLLRTTKLYNVRGVATTKISLPARVLYKNTNVEHSFHQKCITSSWQIRTIVEQAQVDEDKEEDSFFTENSFAHRVLKSTNKYNIAKSPKLLPIISEDEAARLIQENWNFMSSEKLVNNFKNLVCYIRNNSENIFDPKYGNVVDGLSKNIHRITDTELQEVLRYLQLVQNSKKIHEGTYKNLFTTLDKECVQRYMHWTPDDLLLMADLWCQLGQSKKTHFLSLALRRLGNKPNRLSLNHLVHFLFFLNIARKPTINMYEIEYRLESCINTLSLDELGVAAMGFFKTQTRIRNSNIVKIYLDKVIDNVKDIHEITLASIMKFLRYNMTYNHISLFRICLKKLIPEVQRLSLLSILHVSHASASLQVYEAELMDIIISRFEQNIDVIRLKDIERILYVMTIFNYDISHPLYQKCIKELNRPEREEEINNFGKAFICALHYMSMANLYPKNLIEKALAKDFILQAYGKDVHKINREALFLDRSVEVELPDYTGPRLEAGTWKSIAQKNRWTLKVKQNQMTNNADTLLLDVLKTCKEIFRFDSAAVVDQTLPHYTKPDIYICLDGNKKPIPVEPLLTELPFGSIKRAPEINLSNSQWIAIIVGGPNCYIRNTTQYCGLIASKLRQLRQIGYTPIMIPHFRWFDLPNEEAKKDFIQNFVLT